MDVSGDSPTRIRLHRAGPDVAHYPPGATFGPRVLNDFEFVWLLSGSAEWRCDDQVIRIRPGTLLLVRPEMCDQFRWDPRVTSAHAYFHFQLVSGGGLGAPDDWPLTRPLTTSAPLAALCQYLLWLGSTPTPEAADRVTDVGSWLLELFVRGPVPTDGTTTTWPEHVDRLLTYIRQTWRGGRTVPFTMTELADAAGVSTGHLSRLFRTYFAAGPVAAIELVRLARSATLLQRSNLAVGTIAEVCGFVNPFHFSRRFRLAYGIAPRSYRIERSDDDPLEPLARARLLPLAHALLADQEAG